MKSVKRIILVATLIGIVLGTVLALGTRNALRATGSTQQAQMDELQATLEQREAEYQAQLELATQSVEGLQATLAQREAAHQAQLGIADETIKRQQDIMEQNKAQLEQVNQSIAGLQGTLAQRDAEYQAQLEAANQTILLLESR